MRKINGAFMKSLFIITLMLFNQTYRAQQVCLDFDSIVIYSLPFEMKTVLSLASDDVRFFDDTIMKVYRFSSDSLLLAFSTCIAVKMEPISVNHEDSGDLRKVVDIYYRGQLIYTLGIDRRGFLWIKGIVYPRNGMLLNFIELNSLN